MDNWDTLYLYNNNGFNTNFIIIYDSHTPFTSCSDYRILDTRRTKYR